jgi:hypothetical protein
MPLKISRILHAGYVFESEGTQIAFDPIFENPFSRNCYAYPEVRFDHEQIKKLKLAAVFISHYHDDHCSLESLDLLDRQTPIYIFCVFEELLIMIQRLGFRNVFAIAIDVPIQIGAITVTPRRALDSEVDSIFQIQASGLNVLNVVDSWIDWETLDQLTKEAPWDLILWPFQTMREIEVLSPSRAQPAPNELPPEWIKQLQKLNPRYIIPSSCQFLLESWSWYNHAFFPVSYRQFQAEMGKALPNTKVVRMNPSVSFVLYPDSIRISSALTWVQPVGEQNVDYKYDPNVKPPSTAEIAMHFAALSEIQTARVYEYCHKGLLEKYNSLEAPADPYFEKPRHWQLKIYDHQGQPRDFHYRIEGGSIESTNLEAGELGWLTEIPISKIFAALELGESLTSMYIRINDQVFAPEIEKEIESADIVEDPLVRCLFSGNFGAYQKAQLERLNY